MKKASPEIVNAILLYLALGAYFLLAQALGLQDEAYLRFINIPIVLYFVNKTIKEKVKSGETHFLKNYASALLTSLLAVALSIVGLTIYIVVFTGVEYLGELSQPFIGGGMQLQLSEYCFALLVEGLCSSIIISLVVMQYWKNAQESKPETRVA